MIRSRAVLAALVLPALGCLASEPSLDPEATLRRYLNATKAGRWAVAYGYLSANDRAYQSLEAYRSARADSPLATLLSKTEFAVKESTLDGDTATFVVAVTGVDVDSLAEGLADRPPEEAMQEMARRAEKGGLPTRTRNQTFVLLKENGLWKVFLGLEVDALVAEGRRLQEEGDFAAARTAFEAALRSSALNAEASAGLMEAEEALAQHLEQEAYFPNIEIRDVRIQRSESPEGEVTDEVAFLRGEVRNTGEQTLSRLAILATCFDDDGNAVYEKEHLVLDVPTGPPNAQNPPVMSEPLKPNSTRKLLMDLEGAPCSSGDVKVGVVSLEFGE